MSDTETIVIDNCDYIVRRRLGWYDSAIIDEKQFKLFVDGKSIQPGTDIASVDRVEIVMTTAEYNLKRLELRIVGMNRSKIKDMPPHHVNILLQKITQLEEDQKREEEELAEGNPTTQS